MTKSPSKETHNHIPFRAHAWMTDYASWSHVPAITAPWSSSYLCYTIFTLFGNSPFASAPSVSPTHIRDLVLLSPPGHSSLFLSPKLTESFRVILTTPTSAKLKGFPHWINLSHRNSFMPPIQDNLPHYILTPIGPCPLKFQKLPKLTRKMRLYTRIERDPIGSCPTSSLPSYSPPSVVNSLYGDLRFKKPTSSSPNRSLT